MDERLDPLAEPMRCAHGGEMMLSADGLVVWLIYCRACDPETVALPTMRTALVSAA